MTIGTYESFYENRDTFVNLCSLVKKMNISTQIPQMEEMINAMKVAFENLKHISHIFDTNEREYGYSMSEEEVEYWNNLTTQEGVVRNSFRMSNGDTVYYYTVSPCNKELWRDLTESGDALCQPDLGLIFMKEGQGMFSLLHEVGHIRFLEKREYLKKSYKVLNNYNRYHSEEIYADNFAIDNWSSDFGNLEEVLVQRIKTFLDQWDFYTSLYHFPRVINLWERYKELV